MEMNLKEMMWDEFFIEDLFHVVIGKNIDGNKIDKNSGQYAYVTRKESNNGLDGFIDLSNESLLNRAFPVITIGNETAKPFVQNFPFFTGTKVNILKPKISISANVLSFIAVCLECHKNKYSYSYSINSTRLKRQKILLPINAQGEPDYAFMEQYMREKESQMIDKYKEYLSFKINDLGLTGGGVNLPNNKEWNEFEIGKLFKLRQGKSKGLNHLTRDTMGVNYLGATNSNNGVLCQVKPTEKLIQEGNCIAFIRNGEGSMGYSVYKAERFIATSDISAGYASFLNKYVGLFITTIADNVRGKYNFGYKRSDQRLKKEKIFLPVNSQGEPDYVYMENYMKRLEYQKLSAYLAHKK